MLESFASPGCGGGVMGAGWREALEPVAVNPSKNLLKQDVKLCSVKCMVRLTSFWSLIKQKRFSQNVAPLSCMLSVSFNPWCRHQTSSKLPSQVRMTNHTDQLTTLSDTCMLICFGVDQNWPAGASFKGSSKILSYQQVYAWSWRNAVWWVLCGYCSWK